MRNCYVLCLRCVSSMLGVFLLRLCLIFLFVCPDIYPLACLCPRVASCVLMNVSCCFVLSCLVLSCLVLSCLTGRIPLSLLLKDKKPHHLALFLSSGEEVEAEEEKEEVEEEAGRERRSEEEWK